MMKRKRKPVKYHHTKVIKRKPLHDNLDVTQPEIEGGDFEYGETNDLFEENIRETVATAD
jgi:hypothetical protein